MTGDALRAASGFVCIGFDGHVLPAASAALLRGGVRSVIHFTRNYAGPDQMSRLNEEIRTAAGGPVLVTVDQEGGRVQRLNTPNWRAYPSAARFECCASDDVEEAARLAWLGARLMAHDLREVGIDVDCLPVLDVPAEGSHAIISDRAYRPPPKV